MTAKQIRYRHYLEQTHSTLMIVRFLRDYPQFRDGEFTFSRFGVTIHAKAENADLADVCELAGFELVVEAPPAQLRNPNLH